MFICTKHHFRMLLLYNPLRLVDTSCCVLRAPGLLWCHWFIDRRGGGFEHILSLEEMRALPEEGGHASETCCPSNCMKLTRGVSCITVHPLPGHEWRQAAPAGPCECFGRCVLQGSRRSVLTEILYHAASCCELTDPYRPGEEAIMELFMPFNAGCLWVQPSFFIHLSSSIKR